MVIWKHHNVISIRMYAQMNIFPCIKCLNYDADYLYNTIQYSQAELKVYHGREKCFSCKLPFWHVQQIYNWHVPYKRMYKSRYLSLYRIPHRQLDLYTGNALREEFIPKERTGNLIRLECVNYVFNVSLHVWCGWIFAKQTHFCTLENIIFHSPTKM